jgi:hypothetical protein
MKTEEKTDSTSTPANSAPAPTADNPAVTTEVLSKSLLPSFPCIVESTEGEVIAYGSKPALRFPIGPNGETAEIDPAMLRGKGTRRLVNIAAGLKLAGLANDKTAAGIANRKWFNSNVRDVWHKVLKFAAKDSLAHGKPVSLGLSTKTNKKSGQVTLTAKHGFEHVLKAPNEKAIEDKANKQSKTRAKRQNRKVKPLVPVVAPENKARIDAISAIALQQERERLAASTVKPAARIDAIKESKALIKSSTDKLMAESESPKAA